MTENLHVPYLSATASSPFLAFPLEAVPGEVSESLLMLPPEQNPVPRTPVPVTKKKQQREGVTKIYYNGFEFTRRKQSGVKVTYSCSFYRKPTWCPGALYYYADTMAFDYENMVPHTCRAPHTYDPPRAPDASACRMLYTEMKDYVDELSESDFGPTKIWELTYEKFYLYTDGAVRGQTKKQVTARVNNARSLVKGSGISALVEAPSKCKLKDSQLGFLQFKYMWIDDKKAKTKSTDPIKGDESGFERVIGWAHPELRDLLLYAGLNVFLDGTCRCTPHPFEQCVTRMMFDPRSKLYLPVFFSLMTSRTQDSYKRLFCFIELALGSKPDINTVVCDFESALILGVRERFPDSRIVGCLFHLKQAWRRKMKKLQIPDTEVSIAMMKGVLDILTVVDPAKVEVQGVTWVKQKIKQRCQADNVRYSQRKWRMFWRYFARIWIAKFPPEFWNVYGMQREIVNRTNNPLERYHRELNTRFRIPHPALDKFIDRIQELAHSYVLQWKSVISKDADAPTREPIQLPRALRLPDIDAIEDSEIETEDDEEDQAAITTAGGPPAEENDLGEELNVSDDSSVEDQISEEDQGPPGYDASFDYETEEKSETVV